jgi:hypothetical protein
MDFSVSEVGQMRVPDPLSIHRRIERQWAECTKVLRQIRCKIAAATERTLRLVFNNESSLIPVPIDALADRRRRDRPRPHD